MADSFMVDDFKQEVLHYEIDTSVTSVRLMRVFEWLRKKRGLPQVLRPLSGTAGSSADNA